MSLYDDGERASILQALNDFRNDALHLKIGDICIYLSRYDLGLTENETLGIITATYVYPIFPMRMRNVGSKRNLFL